MRLEMPSMTMEEHMDLGRTLRALILTSATAASVAILVTAASQTARAEDAAHVLKTMTDYMGAQKSISATFDSDIEVNHTGASENPVHQFRTAESQQA
jgi:hypothetical protein